jgi:hypothetical protein
VRSSIGLQKVNDWTLWRGQPIQNGRTDIKNTALGKGWWYTWTGSHLIRKLLRMSGIKEGAVGE